MAQLSTLLKKIFADQQIDAREMAKLEKLAFDDGVISKDERSDLERYESKFTSSEMRSRYESLTNPMNWTHSSYCTQLAQSDSCTRVIPANLYGDAASTSSLRAEVLDLYPVMRGLNDVPPIFYNDGKKVASSESQTAQDVFSILPKRLADLLTRYSTQIFLSHSMSSINQLYKAQGTGFNKTVWGFHSPMLKSRPLIVSRSNSSTLIHEIGHEIKFILSNMYGGYLGSQAGKTILTHYQSAPIIHTNENTAPLINNEEEWFAEYFRLFYHSRSLATSGSEKQRIRYEQQLKQDPVAYLLFEMMDEGFNNGTFNVSDVFSPSFYRAASDFAAINPSLDASVIKDWHKSAGDTLKTLSEAHTQFSTFIDSYPELNTALEKNVYLKSEPSYNWKEFFSKLEPQTQNENTITAEIFTLMDYLLDSKILERCPQLRAYLDTADGWDKLEKIGGCLLRLAPNQHDNIRLELGIRLIQNKRTAQASEVLNGLDDSSSDYLRIAKAFFRANDMEHAKLWEGRYYVARNQSSAARQEILSHLYALGRYDECITHEQYNEKAEWLYDIRAAIQKRYGSPYPTENNEWKALVAEIKKIYESCTPQKMSKYDIDPDNYVWRDIGVVSRD